MDYIKKYYPTTSTQKIADTLGISASKVRSIAQKHHIVKCPHYKERLKKELVKNRRNWYERNIPIFKPTMEQEQIIFGSLLGDGYISKGASRSINYYYQEHFGSNQRSYREWKLSKLANLGFSINQNYLRSPSHPYFTNIYTDLYPNNTKAITTSFIQKCTHPLFLLTLYLDDGSLNFSYYYNKKKNTVYCHPSIVLYTLNFLKEDNERLATHLNQTFGTNFSVSSHPDGHKSLLKINKEKDVRRLLNKFSPYAAEIPSMAYKTSVEENLNLKRENIMKRFGKNVNIKLSSSERNKEYTKKEIATIIKYKNLGYTDQDIADELGRTYWSIVYKISSLRKEGKL